MQSTELLQLDHQHIWHPCSQMKDYESFKPLVIKRARGAWLELKDGSKLIDATSSWWCKSLGHNHPRLKKVLQKQLKAFEHVILANTTNATIVELSSKLAQLTQTLHKVFYAGDGSSAVEVALKMSLHARQIEGDLKRTKFIALKNGYHGETLGALSVSDMGLYRKPYEALLFETYYIENIPYVSDKNDPLWNDCSAHWQKIESALTKYAETATAIIIEPILQAATGMKTYSKDFLQRLRHWSKKKGIHLIGDEIMTGIGRTGKMLACQHAAIEPDFLCLSKGLTSGWLPFSVTLTTDEIYRLFYDDYTKGKSFLHSHTFSGNVLGACVAIEVLNIMEAENRCDYANELGALMYKEMRRIAESTQKLTNIRSIGAMVAGDLTSNSPRIGFEVYRKATALGVLLRPLGKTIYWTPPLNTEFSLIEKLSLLTERAILAV